MSVEVADLAPATAYYYRADSRRNAHGWREGQPSPNTFTTLPSPSVLPDGRGWEMVSPPDKHGAAIEIGLALRGAAVDPGRAWTATRSRGSRAGRWLSEPEGNRSFELAQLLSARERSEWSTHEP